MQCKRQKETAQQTQTIIKVNIVKCTERDAETNCETNGNTAGLESISRPSVTFVSF